MLAAVDKSEFGCRAKAKLVIAASSDICITRFLLLKHSHSEASVYPKISSPQPRAMPLTCKKIRFIVQCSLGEPKVRAGAPRGRTVEAISPKDVFDHGRYPLCCC